MITVDDGKIGYMNQDDIIEYIRVGGYSCISIHDSMDCIITIYNEDIPKLILALQAAQEHTGKNKENIMKELFLEDLSGFTQKVIKEHLISAYEINKEALENKRIILAYESVGSWGCDSSAYTLFKDDITGKLYENHASHCSCYGFENQWEPEEVTPEYLVHKVTNGNLFWTGGYDGNSEANIESVKKFILDMFTE